MPHKMKLCVTKCNTCHRNSRGDNGAKRDPSAPPEPAPYHKRHACHAECRLIYVAVAKRCRYACHAKSGSMSPSATPATQSEGRCHQVPRLPRKVKVDVAKRHACHTNSRGDNGAKRDPSAPPEPAPYHKRHACHAECRLIYVAVAKRCRYACHAKSGSMSPSATPATQSEGRCHQVPRLPRKVTVDVTKCHACHAK